MTLGALVVPRVERHLSLQLLFAGSVATFGVAMLGFASVRQYWIACIFTALAGACIATLTVAGNSYVVRTTSDAIRGRVFTAQESVIRVSLLLSMIVMAPLGDIVANTIRDIVARSGVPYDEVYLTGPRITLWVALADRHRRGHLRLQDAELAPGRGSACPSPRRFADA